MLGRDLIAHGLGAPLLVVADGGATCIATMISPADPLVRRAQAPPLDRSSEQLNLAQGQWPRAFAVASRLKGASRLCLVRHLLVRRPWSSQLSDARRHGSASSPGLGEARSTMLAPTSRRFASRRAARDLAGARDPRQAEPGTGLRDSKSERCCI